MPDHVRHHRSLLAKAEKRLLIAIASRLPRFVNSDHLTLLALAAMAVAGLAFGLARFDVRAVWIVVAALAVNWFGDSLDGTLARVRRLERPRYGFYVDHVVDLAGTTLLAAGMAASGFMNPLIALAFLVAYLLVSAEVFLATGVVGVFRMSFAGVGPTELRILLAAGAIALQRDPHVDLGNVGRLPLFDFGGLIAIAGLVVTFVTGAVRNTRLLSRQEPRPMERTAEGGKEGPLELPPLHGPASA
jgi:phosphatidylglycerophosphate synthase